MSQRETDRLITNVITKTIDTYNTIVSPVVINTFKKVKGDNWIRNEETIENSTGKETYYIYVKNNLAEYDTLSIRVDPVNELKYKKIKGINVKFDAKIANTISIPKLSSITGIIFDKEYPVIINQNVKKNNSIECELFGDGVNGETIYNAIQNYEFFINLNFNGNKSNCKLSISNIMIEIIFDNELDKEKEALYNRLEPYFNDLSVVVDAINQIVNPTYTPVMTLTTQYEMLKSSTLECTLMANDIPLPNAEIEWYVNDVFQGSTNTNDDGVARLAWQIDDLTDFKLECRYAGHGEYNSASMVQNVTAVKMNPNITCSLNKERKNYQVNNSTYEPMIIDCDNDLVEEYPIKITYKLYNNNTLLSSVDYGEVDDDFYIELLSYPKNVNKIIIEAKENDWYSGQTITISGITINNMGSNQTTFKSPTVSLASSYNYYGDYLYFKVMLGNQRLKSGTCNIKVGNKTLSNVKPNGDGYYLFRLNTANGVSNTTKDKTIKYVITYNGDKANNINSVKKNGTFKLHAKDSKTVFFNKYNGYDKNSNTKPYRKWYTLESGKEKVCVCGNSSNPISSSSGTYPRPRKLKCSSPSLNIADAVIDSVTVSYEDANYPKNDNLNTHNSISIGKSKNQCTIHLGKKHVMTDKVNAGNKTFKKHSFKLNGSWSLKQINDMYIILDWAKNTNGNVGRLKVRNCKVKVSYRIKQTIS